MTIEWILIVVNLVIGALGWFMRNWINDLKLSQKELENKIDNTRNELTNVQLHYVHKSDLQELKREILGRFDKLEEWIKK